MVLGSNLTTANPKREKATGSHQLEDNRKLSRNVSVVSL
jgi:hypothetical protein